MRLWYWFLLVVAILGFALIGIGYYYMSIGDYKGGFNLMMYGTLPLAIVLAIAFVSFQRHAKNWWER